MPFHVKVDADLHHGKAAQGEAFGVVLQVDLLHGGLGGLVQFQFHDVERGGRAHHHVHPSLRGTYFHIHIHAQEAEDDVEHLLVVAFVIRMVAVRDSGKERLQQPQCIVQSFLVNGFIEQGHGGQSVGRAAV